MRGNHTGEVFTFSYDNRNRMVGFTDFTTYLKSVGTYLYDGLGQRVQKAIWNQATGLVSTTRFAYDNQQIWVDLTGANALQTRYIRGDRAPELLARIDSLGNAAWMLVDRMGSLRNVVNGAGAVIGTLAYDGFGNKTVETSPANSGAYQYAGYRWDAETGLLRPDPSEGRVYDPFMAQWREFDPIGFGGGDANLRRYVGNNATNKLPLRSILLR